MRYEEPRDVGRDALYDALAAPDAGAVCHTLIGVVFHDDDPVWLQETCLDLLGHPSGGVRRLAALSLGHIARIHGTLDTDAAAPALRALLEDPEARAGAEDALDDIAHFLGHFPDEDGV